MKFFTSYFSQFRKLTDSGVFCVSIARFPPGWWQSLPCFHSLAPSRELLEMYHKGRLTQRQFTVAYATTTLALFKDSHRLMAQLLAEFCEGDKDIALLCHEDPRAFCHRHIAADFLSLTGAEVVEWTEAATAPISDNPLFKRRVT